MAIDPARLRTLYGEPPRLDRPTLPGYRLHAHMRLDMMRVMLLGLLLLPVFAYAIVFGIAALGGRDSYSLNLISTGGVVRLVLAALVALFGVPFVHEVIHGLAVLLVGQRPSFGLGPGVAWTSFNAPVGRAAYLTIGLAPLVVISAAAILLGARYDALAGWMLFAGIVNASGAAGDLWMTWVTLRQPRHARYLDLADGFAVYVPGSEPPAAAADDLPTAQIERA